MTLDELFEQKNDVAQAVLEELEKVISSFLMVNYYSRIYFQKFDSVSILLWILHQLVTDALDLWYSQVCSFQCLWMSHCFLQIFNMRLFNLLWLLSRLYRVLLSYHALFYNIISLLSHDILGVFSFLCSVTTTFLLMMWPSGPIQ